MKKTKWSIQKLVMTGMLAAVAGVLMSLEFSVPMMPPFYKVDFSDVPAVIAIFMMGPLSGACVEMIKIIIKLITVGTNTMYVGEFANILGILLFVLPIWLIFKKKGETKKAAVQALAVNLPIRIAFSCFCNACITLPLYAKAMSLPLDQVIQIVAAINPAIKDLTTFIILATIPFNLLKLFLNYLVGFLIYTQLIKARVIQKGMK